MHKLLLNHKSAKLPQKFFILHCSLFVWRFVHCGATVHSMVPPHDQAELKQQFLYAKPAKPANKHIGIVVHRTMLLSGLIVTVLFLYVYTQSYLMSVCEEQQNCVQRTNQSATYTGSCVQLHRINCFCTSENNHWKSQSDHSTCA